MSKDVYDIFMSDGNATKALDSSEIWKIYSKSELERDATKQKVAFEKKVEDENNIMDNIDQFQDATLFMHTRARIGSVTLTSDTLVPIMVR